MSEQIRTKEINGDQKGFFKGAVGVGIHEGTFPVLFGTSPAHRDLAAVNTVHHVMLEKTGEVV